MNLDHRLLLETFAAEAEEQLTALEQGLLMLESEAHPAELLKALFRAAHTLKGNASLVGAQPVVERAHQLESTLEALTQGHRTAGRDLVTQLLRVVDELRAVLPRVVEDAGETRAVRVPIGRLDKMLTLLGELTVARERISELLTGRAAHADIEDAQRDADQLFLDLQDQLMKARMLSIGPLFRLHRRTVRDLALAHGKNAVLDLEGEDVEVDAAVMEALRDPLMHLIRNAIGHGLEAPAARAAAGKEAAGRLRLAASYEGGRVIITFSDDGRGLDTERITAKARELGLIGADATVTERAARNLIFLSGFSTAESVGELSGRGVGMDVVRRNVEALRGTVEVDSRPGEGTSFRISMPLTLAIIESLAVGVGEDTYVLPLESVVECVDLPRGGRERAAQGVLDLRGSPLPFLRLGELFGTPRLSEGRESVVVVRHGDQVAGLAVDALHGQGQTVIRPLPGLVDHMAGVSGAAMLGTGRVALILDVPRLFERFQRATEAVA